MDAPTFQRLELAKIREPEIPARLSIDAEALATLADDIAVNGLLQPIGVAGPDADGKYEVGFGHRRYLAHRLNNASTIDCKVWPHGTPLDDVRSSENYQREPLSPIEEANDVARRLARGEPRAAIARALRRSLAWIDTRERLMHLPEELQIAVHAGELAIGVALVLAEIDHEPYRRSLVQEAVANGASVSMARVWAAHYERDKPRIIANELAVQEIVEARNAFVVYCECEGCRREVNFTTTRSMRFCQDCAKSIAQELAGPAQAS